MAKTVEPCLNPSPGLRPPSPGGRGDQFNLSHIRNAMETRPFSLSHIRKAVASRSFSPREKVPDRADEGAFCHHVLIV